MSTFHCQLKSAKRKYSLFIACEFVQNVTQVEICSVLMTIASPREIILLHWAAGWTAWSLHRYFGRRRNTLHLH